MIGDLGKGGPCPKNLIKEEDRKRGERLGERGMEEGRERESGWERSTGREREHASHFTPFDDLTS